MAFLITALGAFSGWLLRGITGTVVLSVIAVLFKDVIFSLVSDVLGMAVNAVNDVFIELPTLNEVIGILPVEVLNVMARVGVDDCLAIIVSAYSIRLAVQMVGFIRGLKPRT